MPTAATIAARVQPAWHLTGETGPADRGDCANVGFVSEDAAGVLGIGGAADEGVRGDTLARWAEVSASHAVCSLGARSAGW